MVVICHVFNTHHDTLHPFHAAYGWCPPLTSEQSATITLLAHGACVRSVVEQLNLSGTAYVYSIDTIGSGHPVDINSRVAAELYVRVEHPRFVYSPLFAPQVYDTTTPLYIHYSVTEILPRALVGVTANLYVKHNVKLHPDCFAGFGGSLHFAASAGHGIRDAIRKAVVDTISFAQGTVVLAPRVLCELDTEACLASSTKLKIVHRRPSAVGLPASLNEICTAALATARITVLDLTHTSVATIGPFAFAHCYALKTCALPAALVSLGTHAFFMCVKLRSINMRACTNLAVIPLSMAEHCRSLVDVALPPSAVEIHNRAFAFCRQLGTIVLPKTIQWVHDAFRGCTALHTCVYMGVLGGHQRHWDVAGIGVVNVVSRASCADSQVWARVALGSMPRVFQIHTDQLRPNSLQLEPMLLQPWAVPPPCCALFTHRARTPAAYTGLALADSSTVRQIDTRTKTAFAVAVERFALPQEIIDLIFKFVHPWPLPGHFDCHMPTSPDQQGVRVWGVHLPERVPPFLAYLHTLTLSQLRAISAGAYHHSSRDAYIADIYQHATGRAPPATYSAHSPTHEAVCIQQAAGVCRAQSVLTY